MASSEEGGYGDGRAAFSFEQLTPTAAPPPPPAPGAMRAEAETIVARAEAQAALIRSQAAARGHEEGFRAGLAAAGEQIGPAAQALHTAACEVDRLRHESAAAVEREAVDLALQIAEKVVAATLELRPETVLEVIKGALRGMLDRERVTVQVNPDDLELVRGAVSDIAGSLGGIDRLEVVAERRVERGGAIVRTAVGEIDARLEEKLLRAREVVEAELGA